MTHSDLLTKQLPKLSILVAESDADNKELYRGFLKDWATAVVSTGEECLQLASTDSFDMIVIDSHIGGLSAVKTIAQIKSMLPSQHIVATSTNISKFEQDLKGAGIVGIDFVQKPFSFIQLLSLLRAKVPRTSKIGLSDHVLAIYDDEKQELEEAIAFLRRAAMANETALFIVRNNQDIEALKGRMQSSGIDVNLQIASGSLIIMHNNDWYIPDSHVDKHRIIEQWNKLVKQCLDNGKSGLRAFCMMDCFFDHDFAEEVVDYEHTLPATFSMPFVPVCAYRKQDIDKLTEEQKRRLVVCHNHVWTSNKDS